MKKYLGLIITVLLAVMLMATTVIASETCDYAAEGEECEIWYFYDEKSHWEGCANHKDTYGNAAAVSEKTPHSFEDGKCTFCEMKEVKGFFTLYYYIVIIVVGILGLWATAKGRSFYKEAKLDQRPFGLDKFKKR